MLLVFVWNFIKHCNRLSSNCCASYLPFHWCFPEKNDYFNYLCYNKLWRQPLFVDLDTFKCCFSWLVRGGAKLQTRQISLFPLNLNDYVNLLDISLRQALANWIPKPHNHLPQGIQKIKLFIVLCRGKLLLCLMLWIFWPQQWKTDGWISCLLEQGTPDKSMDEKTKKKHHLGKTDNNKPQVKP